MAVTLVSTVEYGNAMAEPTSPNVLVVIASVPGVKLTETYEDGTRSVYKRSSGADTRG